MATQPKPSERALVRAILPPETDATVKAAAVGLNWTLVVSDIGAGVVHTPAKSRQGCGPVEGAGSLAGQPLQALLDRVDDPNPIARALAFAAMNAYWNRYDLQASVANGLETMASDANLKTVVVGRFPKLDEKLPNAEVIERDPRPGDHPEEAAATLIPDADQLVITGSTLSNGSLDNLLSLRRTARTVLVGPSTPLCPALFPFGIDALSGFRVEDPDRALRAIIEGGAAKALKAAGKPVTLWP